MTQTNNFNNDLTRGSVSRQLIKFAVPFLMSNLLQAFYNVADMIIVGRFCGKAGITGVSIGGQINILVTGAAMGLAIGGTVLVAQYAGARKFDEQRKTIGTLSTLYVLLAVVITIVMLTVGRQLLVILKTPQSAFAEAESYFNICMGGTIFMFMYNAISAVLRGMGDSKRPLIFVLIAAVTNVVLDIVLVKYFNMGAAGAAWATITAQALSVVLSIIYLFKIGFFESYSFRDFIPQKNKAKELFKIGFPSSVQSLVVSLSFLTLTALVNSLPNAEVASAVQGIGGKVNSFAILPAIAISSAISSMAGQNIGAKEFERAKKTMLTGMVMAIGISAVCTALVNLFPGFIIRLFDNEPEVVQTGLTYLRYISIDYCLAGCSFCMNGLAIGAGYTNFALVNALFSSIFIRVPLAYFFVMSANLGFNGVGLAIGMASLGSIVLGVIFVQKGYWRRPKIRL